MWIDSAVSTPQLRRSWTWLCFSFEGRINRLTYYLTGICPFFWRRNPH